MIKYIKIIYHCSDMGSSYIYLYILLAEFLCIYLF